MTHDDLEQALKLARKVQRSRNPNMEEVGRMLERVVKYLLASPAWSESNHASDTARDTLDGDPGRRGVVVASALGASPQ